MSGKWEYSDLTRVSNLLLRVGGPFKYIFLPSETTISECQTCFEHVIKNMETYARILFTLQLSWENTWHPVQLCLVNVLASVDFSMYILVWQTKKCMTAKPLNTQHSTKQYINCTITVRNGANKLLGPTQSCPNSSPNLPLLHLAISEALSSRATVHSALFTAFKKTQLIWLICLKPLKGLAPFFQFSPKMTYPSLRPWKQRYAYSWYNLKGNTLKFMEI